jgi:tRNA/rRNA methyltransferase
VCLYELVRDLKAAGKPEKQKRATAGEVERITTVLLDVLRVSGYLKPGTSNADQVRRIVRHLNVPARETELWLGLLRQILWKLRSEGARAGSAM